MKNKVYTYYIIFNFTDSEGRTGTSASCIERKEKIKTYKHIEKLSKYLCEVNKLTNIVITDWKELKSA